MIMREHGDMLIALNTELTALGDVLDQIAYSGWTPDVVVGIARGGLVPMVMMSHALHIPAIPLQWSTRDFKHRVTSVLDMIKGYENVLIMEDLTDSGKTLAELRNALGNGADNHTIKYAALFKRYTSPEPLDFVGAHITDDAWVDFSWELAGAFLSQERAQRSVGDALNSERCNGVYPDSSIKG